MNTNHIPGPSLVAVLKCALTVISIAALAITAAAQTNTFPSSGNAGVGTTTPNSTLTVVGNVGVEANTSFNSGVGLLGLDTSNGYLQLYDSTRTMRTYFSSRAGINSYINNGGNVGIGTTNPQWGRLQVNKIIRIDDDSASPVGSDTMMSAPMLYLGTTVGGNAFQFNGGGGLDLWQYNAGWGRTVTFAKTGYVGIGTTTPGRKLEILAPNGEALRVYRNANNIGWGVNMVFAFNNSSNEQRDYAGLHGILQSNTAGSEQGTLVFSTATAGTLTEKLRIDSAGKVGVGLGAPLYSLDVNGGVNAFRAKASTTSGSDTIATFENSSGISAIIRANGNMGIGATSPNYKLDVQGGQINSSGGLCIAGDCKSSWSQVGGGGGSSQWTTSGSSIYYNSGNVGIGTASPGARLHVSAGDSSVALFGPNPSWGGSLAVGSGADLIAPISGRGQVLSSNGNLHLDAGTGQNVYLSWLNTSNTIINGQGGNVGIGTASPTEKLHVSGNGKVTGNFTVDGTINAKYQDVAEWVSSTEELAAATVVVLDPTKENQVISSTVAYDTRVAGVISAQPGITLGESGAGKVLVATTGRVRVKVDAARGPIQIGDLLVTSDIPGVAMRSDPVELAGRKMHMPGTIIGKALAPLPKGRGEILVLLSLQ